MILPSTRQSAYDAGRKPGSLPAFGKTTNQTMDSQDNNYTAPTQENGVIDESGNVDRIRNILFGSQMRDYEAVSRNWRSAWRGRRASCGASSNVNCKPSRPS